MTLIYISNGSHLSLTVLSGFVLAEISSLEKNLDELDFINIHYQTQHFGCLYATLQR